MGLEKHELLLVTQVCERNDMPTLKLLIKQYGLHDVLQIICDRRLFDVFKFLIQDGTIPVISSVAESVYLEDIEFLRILLSNGLDPQSTLDRMYHSNAYNTVDVLRSHQHVFDLY